MRVAITSGYYLFCHPGHLVSFQLARDLADSLTVIVNNDAQFFMKKGFPSPQSEQDRLAIVSAFRMVDRAVLATDRDSTVCETLEHLIKEAQAEGHEVVMAKGGDRFGYEIPERKICEQYGVKIIDGLGTKTHSSSEYIKRVRE